MVTTFTVDSYKSLALSPPPDASAQLLARISLQLESFAVGPMFANSTVPSLSLVDAAQTGAATSGPVPVKVNILWIVSLTLSLLSALYSIAAQQWLRHLRIPSHLSAQVAVQLLQIRYESLHYWQIPGIISLLPVLLQSAVILFLIGFIILLQSLNRVAAISLAVVGGGGVLLFLLAAAVPLWNTHCAYKSSLIPAITIALQAISYPLAVLPVIFWRIVLLFIENDSVNWITHYLNLSPITRQYTYIRNDQARRYLLDFGAHILVDLGTFWMDRELSRSSPAHQVRGLTRACPSLTSDGASFAQVTSRIPLLQEEWWHEVLGIVFTGLSGSYVTGRASLFFDYISPAASESLAHVRRVLWDRVRIGVSVQQTKNMVLLANRAALEAGRETRVRFLATEAMTLVLCHGACLARPSVSHDFARVLWAIRVARSVQPNARRYWAYHIHVLLLFEYRTSCFQNLSGESRVARVLNGTHR